MSTLRTVSAIFRPGGSLYDYLVPEGDHPQVGDIIMTSGDVAFFEQALKFPGDLARINVVDTPERATKKSATSTRAYTDDNDDEDYDEINYDTPPKPVKRAPTAEYMQETKTAVIVLVHDCPSSKATRFYLGRIAAEEIVKNNKSSKAIAEKLKKQRDARERLEKLVKEHNRMSVYRALAQDNAEARELLKILED